jgi:hypothetical protein
MDACDHAHYSLHNRTYFAGLIFADSRLSAKTTKIRPHENFPLYGNYLPNHRSALFTEELSTVECILQYGLIKLNTVSRVIIIDWAISHASQKSKSRPLLVTSVGCPGGHIFYDENVQRLPFCYIFVHHECYTRKVEGEGEPGNEARAAAE